MQPLLRIKLLLLLSLAGWNTSYAQGSFYARDTIQVIDITFAQSNWDYMLDTAKTGSDGYILAVQCVINGVVFDSVGVKFKGNSSYDSSRTKNPLHIELDYIHGNADYQGFDNIKLGNGFSDPSAVREVLAFDILGNYMDAPRSNFARVTINGNYYGLFSNTESIDKDFLSTHFYSQNNSFFKCNPVNVLSGQVPNLLYLGQDSANYYSRYEIKSAYAWKELIALCDTLANSPASIDTVIDVDRALWMLAFNNALVNLDSYTGAFAQNYYLYRDDNRQFVPVIWDLNMCFGGFTNTGTGILNVSAMQQMTPLLHATYGARPLIVKLLADSTCNRMYIAHMRTIMSEFVANGSYLTLGQNLQTLIDSSIQAETAPLYPYAGFQQNLNSTVSGIVGISTLMSARDTYLNGTVQFTAVQPVVSAVTASPAAPLLNGTVYVTASITNAAQVWLGFRDQVYRRFYRVPMYDDGLHQDGAAGDNVYGASFTASSALMQYYIYAQNTNAGIFSPQRAEHEFYSIIVATTTPQAGEVVINEFVASNAAGAVNEAGNHEDWIELYNRTATPFSLSGLYLSDDAGNVFKSPLPDVIIPPYSYLIVWADGNASTAQYAHCNFKLSAAGEMIYLSNANGNVLDSVIFGAQTADVSFGRCPNGSGAFQSFNPPTFNALNTCPAGVQENAATTVSTIAYPNPANNQVTLFTNHANAVKAELTDAAGRLIAQSIFYNDKAEMTTAELPQGMYFFRIANEEGTYIDSGKILIMH
ncbi:MAG: CotH kinase family protein [Bacteroidetes bacterium]|nr:CotH kinase family protein [Bacteroidota bacterium]